MTTPLAFLHLLATIRPLLVCVFLLLAILKLKNYLTGFNETQRRRQAAFRSIPGPRGLPLIGSAFAIDRAKPYTSFEAWARQYGPIYRLNIFNNYIVVLSNVESFREAMVEKSMDFAGRPPQFYRAKFMADEKKDLVSASPCATWHMLRKAVQREVKKYDPSTLRLEELTMDVIDDLIDEVRQSSGKPFNVREALFTGIVNTNCMLLIGEKLPRDDERLSMMKELVTLVTKAMSMGGKGSELDLFPWLRFFGNSTYKNLVSAKKIREKTYAWMKEKVDSDLRDETNVCGVVHGFQKLLELNEGVIDETNVKLAIVNLMIGGTSASHHYLYLMLHILAQHPEIQDRLFEEVNKVVGSDRKPSIADKESMHYTKAFILEMFRWGSVSPILIPHCTIVDTSVGGYSIPSNTTVLATFRSVHHDPVFWPQPLHFDPTRFLEADTGKLLPSSHPNLKHLVSFGAGVRGCPGESFAKSRIFLFLSSIVQAFEVQADADLPFCHPDDFDLGLVLSPKDFSVRYVPRNT